jgi:hypothetical protein
MDQWGMHYCSKYIKPPIKSLTSCLIGCKSLYKEKPNKMKLSRLYLDWTSISQNKTTIRSCQLSWTLSITLFLHYNHSLTFSTPHCSWVLVDAFQSH